MTRLASFLVILFSSMLLAAEPTTIPGRVVSVADWDTITVLDATKTQQKIRLAGIDTPENSQAFGTKSKESLATLVFGKDVVVTIVDKDRYGRWVGKVKQGNVDMKMTRVRDGKASRDVM